jgi:hypothetical protein
VHAERLVEGERAVSKRRGLPGRAAVRAPDGTTSRFRAPFRKTSHAWERATVTVTAPPAYQAIVVAVVYQDQTGTAVFDDVTLTSP